VEFDRADEHVSRDETYFLMELEDDDQGHAQVYDDAIKDRLIYRVFWCPLDEAAARLTFEPARTFARLAAERVKAHPG
jgi:hypothetical protein